MSTHSLFFNIDPLAGAATMISGRSLIVPMLIGGAAFVILGLILGRVWCGWACPMGSLIEWTPARQTRGGKGSGFWRSGKYFTLFTILLAATLGSLTLEVLDPMSLLYRSLASMVPVLSMVVSLVISALSIVFFSVTPVYSGLAWFDTNVRLRFLGDVGFYPPSLILLVVFAGVLALNAIKPRAWCRFLCPLGGLNALLAKLSLMRHSVDKEKCTSCDKCSQVCNAGAIHPELNYAADRSECNVCLDCVDECPTNAIKFSLKSRNYEAFQPERRKFISTLAFAAIGAFLIRFSPRSDKPNAKLVRPPGATETSIGTKCIRCGECARACPTNAIQPLNSFEAWDTMWSPNLIIRRGYCDYSCNACGRVCPSGAIPNLELEEKRLAVIGTAAIDENRCIPFAENRNCGICAKVCPLPENAITLKTGVNGIARPYVDTNLCIGCGICEYECPVQGDAAIRVNQMLPSPV